MIHMVGCFGYYIVGEKGDVNAAKREGMDKKKRTIFW